MAGRPSGDHPADSANGAIEGQKEQTQTRGDEQTLADSEQTLADAEQTLADAEQTSAERDQASADRDQIAADSDQAASDSGLEHGSSPLAYEYSRDLRRRSAQEREQTTVARLVTAGERDGIAHARDLAASARDHAAAARDQAMNQLDATCEDETNARAYTGAQIVMRAAEQRKRAAQQRARAADQRASSADDRQAAARDRQAAARDRLQARTDREALAAQLAISATDPLTGARTRRAGLTDLDHELERCRRTSGMLVVAYVDVIGLKRVNDAQGHPAGDQLLKRVVALITTHLRPYDLVIRLGGDEFLCAMSNISLAHARQRFGAIAAALAASPDAGAIRAGFAQLTPGEEAEDLVARADKELVERRHR